eukprot:GFUD01038641.1.p1 GENE.GFUD01038641.1~~GFUD01038641.1.p1  ORF type:complete len:108 (+),score=28.86 GFUD01038641.1:50-373(+)
MSSYRIQPAGVQIAADQATQLKFSLPSVQFTGSTLQLSSLAELDATEGYKCPSPFWNCLIDEAPSSLPQVVPSAANLTSLTYLGDRRSHPQFRMRIYEILQHRVGQV